MESQKYSEKWNNDFPNSFKGENYGQDKGRLIEDLRNLERQIDNLKIEAEKLTPNETEAKMLLPNPHSTKEILEWNCWNENTLKELKTGMSTNARGGFINLHIYDIPRQLDWNKLREPFQSLRALWILSFETSKRLYELEHSRKREKTNFENRIRTFEKENNENYSFLFPNQPYDFFTLQSELKRLKIQDLTIQIPLKKQEFEQATNNLKNNLCNAGKYLLDKLLKKHQKLLQNNEITSDKLVEITQTLGEELNSHESLQTLLAKQSEIYQLEQHLTNLQQISNTEQLAQVVQLPPQG